jgi:hypothetical protein
LTDDIDSPFIDISELSLSDVAALPDTSIGKMLRQALECDPAQSHYASFSAQVEDNGQ